MNCKSLFFACSLIFLGSTACAHTLEFPTPPQYIGHPLGELPIVASYALYPPSMTDQHMKWVKEANFNAVTKVLNYEETDSLVRLARKFDISVLVANRDIWNPEKKISIIKHYQNNSTIWGNMLADEPKVSYFNTLAEMDSILRRWDPNKLRVYNLLPAVLPQELGAKDYESYVREFILTVNPPFLCYDIYPVKLNSKKEIYVEPLLYKTIEVIRLLAEESNRPFWSYILCNQHWNYPKPTREYLRFAVFTALSYGAQGLIYYTYLLPDFDKGIGEYSNAPIDLNGKRTDVWYMVRDINKEVRNLEKVFVGANVVDVSQTGDVIPDATHRIKSLPFPFVTIESEGVGVTVSHLRNGEEQYLVLVNRDIEQKQKVYLSHTRPVVRIYANGSEKEYKGNTFTLTPGGYAIFKFNNI